MKKIIPIAVSSSALLIFLGTYIRRRNMSKEIIIKDGERTFQNLPHIRPTQKPTDRDAFHKEEFMSRVRAMSMDELEMIVDYVPVELCMKRISNEIERAKNIKETIKATAASFEG